MDTPQPPRDSSLRNIIDKLAEFVARNGPEFELITKQKQQGNPKFEFLYGGEHCSYYQYRVAAEQAYLKQQGPPPQQAPTHASHQPHHYHVQSQQSQHQQHSQTHQTQQSHEIASGVGIYPNQGLSVPTSTHNMWGMNANNLQGNPSVPSSSNGSAAINLRAQIETINMQKNSLREQIHQSELNLSAQHLALLAQQKKQIDEAIAKAQNIALEKQAEENNISIMEFDDILQPIIDACTKDSISAGKNWILQHSTDTAKNNVVLQYLLKKALVNGSTFTQKLHLIYLVNDILHHCVRKNANDLKNSLENVVIPMFCSAELIATDEQRTKLSKLLSLWESKAKFFDACVISKLQSPDSSMQEYKTNLMNVHHEITSNVTHTTKATFESYQKQHHIFIQHATQQIQVLEQQMQNLEQQIIAAVLPNPSLLPSLMDSQQHVASIQIGVNNSKPQMMSLPNNQLPPQPLMAQKVSMPVDDDDSNGDGLGASVGGGSVGGNIGNSGDGHKQFNHHNIPPEENDQPLYGNLYSNPQMILHQNSMFGGNNNGGGNSASTNNIQPPFGNNSASNDYPGSYQQPGQNVFSSGAPHVNDSNEYQGVQPASFLIPDLSKPPPGFLDNSSGNALSSPVASGTQPLDVIGSSVTAKEALGCPIPAEVANEGIPADAEVESKPSAPYYDLPAGLMVSLIRLEDYNYRPLNPEEIRLPPPAPQSERLTLALAAFYAPPSHNRPRDNEGWEKLGLYEYYKVKNAAKKQKEDELKSGTREKTRSPSPIIIEHPKPKKINNKRCYSSKSPSRSPSRPKSRSPYRSRSRSPPPVRPQTERTRGSRYSNSQRNRSPSSRRSPIRDRSERNERSNVNNSDRIERSNERDRDRDRDRDRERDRENTNRESNNRQERNSTRRERERSVTPPSFLGGAYGKTTDFIEESNKGHQMLMKMGWGGSGTGLGTKSQGIDQPVSSGDIRDRKDMYKGVGLNMNDPFENFRKNKGAAFVHRMRSRADEKS